MRVDGNAAAIVAHDQDIAGLQLQLDARGMAGHGLVHGIVDDLGGQVMQGIGVGAADIHAGPPADRLQPLQHLDILGGVTFRPRGGGVEQVGIVFGHGMRRRV